MKFLDRFRKNKEPDFFELLTKQAEFINKGIRLLNEYCITLWCAACSWTI